jgi:PEP-CTERM motif
MKIRLIVSSRLAWILLAFGVSGIAHANLITNASFEDVPGSAIGQNLMPSDWIRTSVTPDTYSDDGSYGLPPDAFGNFTGVTAYDGKRWVAAWSAAGQETFGQWLGTSVVAGQEYDFSGWLQQALRADINFSGGYEIYLTDTPGVKTEYLGFLGSTTSAGAGWEEYSFTFTATDIMEGLGFLEFAPIVTAGTGAAYPGLDLVSLTVVSSVPEPGTLWLLLPGLVSIFGLSRRKHHC